MKFSDIINYPLRLAGIKMVRLSKLKKLQEQKLPVNNADIEKDALFMELYEQVKPFTMVGIERCYALYTAVNFVLDNNVDGDMVECGVWKGGSAMLVALLLKKKGITDRTIYMYDTFSGMTEPGINDGAAEKQEWEQHKKEDGSSDWCYASYEEVEANMKSTGYPFEKIKLVKGKVEDTIPEFVPDKIALLRLDTDWYASTKHELEHLYPLLEKNGILIIDDYGAWPGAKKATDEYFEKQTGRYLHRIDFTGRLLVK